jgi:hypothetical protein
MHFICFNKYGAERRRHALNSQITESFVVLCPLCNSDETNRLDIEDAIISHLTNTKDTEEYSVERTVERTEEQSISTLDNDSSYNLNPDENIAVLTKGITCFCCKLLILEEHVYQVCLSCDRKLHSDPCFENESDCIKAHKLSGVCHGKPCLTY